MSRTLRDKIQAAALRFADEVATAIETHVAGDEYVDQNHSPLGKRRHLEAVRSGELPGCKDGKKVLVKKTDLESYLQRKCIHPAAVSEEEVDALLQEALRRSA